MMMMTKFAVPIAMSPLKQTWDIKARVCWILKSCAVVSTRTCQHVTISDLEKQSPVQVFLTRLTPMPALQSALHTLGPSSWTTALIILLLNWEQLSQMI